MVKTYHPKESSFPQSFWSENTKYTPYKVHTNKLVQIIITPRPNAFFVSLRLAVIKATNKTIKPTMASPETIVKYTSFHHMIGIPHFSPASL